VPRVEYDKLSDQRLGEPATAIPKRVEAARQLQRERLISLNEPAGENTRTSIHCDARIQPADIQQFWEPDDTSQALIRSEMSQLQLMVRAKLLDDEGGGVVVMDRDRKDIYNGIDFIHSPRSSSYSV
jgi:magnesium chelatase family protein